MIRNYFLINLILLVIIGFLGFRFYKVYSFPFKVPVEPAAKRVLKETPPVKSNDTVPDASHFQIISNLDLFRPSRTPYKEDVKQQEAPKNPPRLFGTIIFGNEKTAILEDPNTKATHIYRVKDSIGGYVISDILEDRVVLSWNGEKSEVKLRDEKKGLPPVKQMVMPQPPPRTTQPTRPQQPQMQPQMPQQQQIQRPLPPQRTLPPQRPLQRRIPRRPPLPPN
jgi:type II secretory pathway component PulC